MRVNTRSTTPMMGGAGRDEGAHLGHEDDEGHLAHIGGLAGHIGAGDDGRPVLGLAHIGVVRHEQAVRPHLLHHRVASVYDLDDARVIYRGAAIVVFHGNRRQRAQRIQFCHGGGGGLNPGHLPGNILPAAG